MQPVFDEHMTRPITKTLIDCHVHLAALPDGDNGCYISHKTLRSPLFRFLLWKQGLSPETPREANQQYLAGLTCDLVFPDR